MNSRSNALLRALWSIKTRITLGAVATLSIAIASTTVILIRQAEHDTLNAQHYRELRESSRTAAVLALRVSDLQRVLRATAVRLDKATFSDAARLSSFLGSNPSLQSLFANVFAVPPDGQVHWMADDSSVHAVDIDVADQPWFAQTLSERRPIVSGPVTGRLTGEPAIVFTYPLVEAGVAYGFLCGALRLSSRGLLDDLEPGDDDTAEALTVVTDTDGRILAHRQRDRITRSLATEARLAQGFANWTAEGRVSEPLGVLVEQAGRVVAVAGVAGTDWIVWRSLDNAQIFAPLRAARSHALFWAAGMVAVASLLSLAVITWLLRPLSLLKDRALHLFDPGHDVMTGWPVAHGEFGELARVLRHVAAERAQLEAFNAQVLAKLHSVLAAAPVGIMFTRQQRFELVSARFCELFGQQESEILGRPVAMMFANSSEHEGFGALVDEAFAGGKAYQGEWQIHRVDGSTFRGRLCGQPVEDMQADAGTIWTLDDVTDQVAARQSLEWSAGHDALTGLANRKTFELRAQKTLDALPTAVPSAVVMIDLDRFKPINDTAGHAAGDAMLKAVAHAITAHVRADDVAARIGGDEFVLLLERCPEDSALRIAESVRRAISETSLVWGGLELKVGASVGVAVLTAEMRSTADWLHQADLACYRVKSAGRGATFLATRPHPAPVEGAVVDPICLAPG